MLLHAYMPVCSQCLVQPDCLWQRGGCGWPSFFCIAAFSGLFGLFPAPIPCQLILIQLSHLSAALVSMTHAKSCYQKLLYLRVLRDGPGMFKGFREVSSLEPSCRSALERSPRLPLLPHVWTMCQSFLPQSCHV